MDHLLTDVVTVKQPAGAADAVGGPKALPHATRFVGVRCWIDAASSSQRELYQQLGLVVTHTAYTKRDGIQNGDVIVDADGMVLRVEKIDRYRQTFGGIAPYFVLGLQQVRLS